jgi:hypothetical protein
VCRVCRVQTIPVSFLILLKANFTPRDRREERIVYRFASTLHTLHSSSYHLPPI